MDRRRILTSRLMGAVIADSRWRPNSLLVALSPRGLHFDEQQFGRTHCKSFLKGSTDAAVTALEACVKQS